MHGKFIITITLSILVSSTSLIAADQTTSNLISAAIDKQGIAQANAQMVGAALHTQGESKDKCKNKFTNEFAISQCENGFENYNGGSVKAPSNKALSTAIDGVLKKAEQK
ncbi:MAG: hypothetical protein PHE67_00120 [Campylobacterales bacterium]|nr:hypothetical protein [Campylobacterales bacterium]